MGLTMMQRFMKQSPALLRWHAPQQLAANCTACSKSLNELKTAHIDNHCICWRTSGGSTVRRRRLQGGPG